jgi:hypothetical protein
VCEFFILFQFRKPSRFRRCFGLSRAHAAAAVNGSAPFLSNPAMLTALFNKHVNRSPKPASINNACPRLANDPSLNEDHSLSTNADEPSQEPPPAPTPKEQEN